MLCAATLGKKNSSLTIKRIQTIFQNKTHESYCQTNVLEKDNIMRKRHFLVYRSDEYLSGFSNMFPSTLSTLGIFAGLSDPETPRVHKPQAKSSHGFVDVNIKIEDQVLHNHCEIWLYITTDQFIFTKTLCKALAIYANLNPQNFFMEKYEPKNKKRSIKNSDLIDMEIRRMHFKRLKECNKIIEESNSWSYVQSGESDNATLNSNLINMDAIG